MSHQGDQAGVTVKDLTEFFEGDAGAVLGFIESVGTPEDVLAALNLPYESRVRMLHLLLERATLT